MFVASAFVLMCMKCRWKDRSKSSAVRQRCKRWRLYSAAHRYRERLHWNCHCADR